MSASKIALVEQLESRRMFAVTPVSTGGSATGGGKVVVSGATLKITANPRTGSSVRVTTAEDGGVILVSFGGRQALAFDKGNLASIIFTGSRFQDRITIREEGGLIDIALIIRPGAGSDYVDLDRTLGRVFGDSGNDTLLGSAGDDVMSGGSGNDRIYGADGFDSLVGQGGNDDLRGDAQDDTLNGGSGNDLLDGGAGSDVLNGEGGSNRLVDRATRGELNIFYGGQGFNQIFGTTTDAYYNLDWWDDQVFFSKPLPVGGEGGGDGEE